MSDGDFERMLSALDPLWRTRPLNPSLPVAPNPWAGGILGPLATPPPPTGAVSGGLLDPIPPSSPNPSPAGIFGALAPVVPPMNPFGRVSPPVVPPLPRAPAPEVKRKVYFAFSFSDVMRVNCVRNSGKIGSRETKKARLFYDRSIWERRSITNDENLKALMRQGVQHSSAIAVLIGTDTWQSRWVRYEIARAVIDRRGLLAIHVNGIEHHERQAPDAPGLNPLDVMAVYKDHVGRYYLYEKVVAADANGALRWEWQPYEDFTDPVQLPRYVPDMNVNRLRPLSTVTSLHDFKAHDGVSNIGAWIDDAAARAGRW